jgi:glucan phosphoethanolaminetransferase (alkaline phosphatase superfamily)
MAQSETSFQNLFYVPSYDRFKVQQSKEVTADATDVSATPQQWSAAVKSAFSVFYGNLINYVIVLGTTTFRQCHSCCYDYPEDNTPRYNETSSHIAGHLQPNESIPKFKETPGRFVQVFYLRLIQQGIRSG